MSMHQMAQIALIAGIGISLYYAARDFNAQSSAQTPYTNDDYIYYLGAVALVIGGIGLYRQISPV